MEPFRYIDDREFQAFGKTREEAFANAAMALMNIMVDCKKVGAKDSRTVNAKAPEYDELLVEFLTELLYLLDVESFMTCKVQDLVIQDAEFGYEMRATVKGDDAKKCKQKTHVEAITHHDLSIEEQEDGSWMVQAVIERS